MGRGTTILEAALLGRIPCGCDINPLSVCLARPRLEPPTMSEVEVRLAAIGLETTTWDSEDLLVFYHPETLQEICALKNIFFEASPNDGWTRWMAGLK